MISLCFYISVVFLGLFYIFSIVKGVAMSPWFIYIFNLVMFSFYVFCIGLIMFDIFSPLLSDSLPASELSTSDLFRSKMFKENRQNCYEESKFSGEMCSNMQSYKSTEYDKVCSFANQE